MRAKGVDSMLGRWISYSDGGDGSDGRRTAAAGSTERLHSCRWRRACGATRSSPSAPTKPRRLLEAAKMDRNAARWSVALALGLRQGEALGLMWIDIDPIAETLTVRRALQRPKGKRLVMADPDSRAGRRTIACPRR